MLYAMWNDICPSWSLSHWLWIGAKTKQLSVIFSLGIDLEVVLVRIAFGRPEEP